MFGATQINEDDIARREKRAPLCQERGGRRKDDFVTARLEGIENGIVVIAWTFQKQKPCWSDFAEKGESFRVDLHQHPPALRL
jgi:endonuclease I